MAAAGGRESPTNSNKEEHWYTSPQGLDPAQRASKRGKISKKLEVGLEIRILTFCMFKGTCIRSGILYRVMYLDGGYSV